MNRHVAESELALFVSGDLGALRQSFVRLHVRGCEECRGRVEAYRLDRERLQEAVAELPPGLDWDRLAAEMAANIRVGLAAGECVAPRPRKRAAFRWVSAGWRPAAI